MNICFTETIADFPGYLITRDGRVLSITRKDDRGVAHRGKVLKRYTHKNGYQYICLSKKGKETNKRVHRLVATAFIPNPENKLCINHLNGDKADNRVENLEWSTHSENEKHSYDNLGKQPWNKR